MTRIVELLCDNLHVIVMTKRHVHTFSTLLTELASSSDTKVKPKVKKSLSLSHLLNTALGSVVEDIPDQMAATDSFVHDSLDGAYLKEEITLRMMLKVRVQRL